MNTSEIIELYKEHGQLVEKIAYGFYNKMSGNIPLDDLKGYGYIGFVNGCNKYDPTASKLTLKQYLGWSIRNSILSGITEYTKVLGGETFYKKYKSKEKIQTSVTSTDLTPGIFQKSDYSADVIIKKTETDELFQKINVFIKTSYESRDYQMFYDYYLSSYFDINSDKVSMADLSKKYNDSPTKLRYKLQVMIKSVKQNKELAEFF